MKTIRGLLILAGLLTSNAVHLYAKAKTVTLYVLAIVALPFAKAYERILKGIAALRQLQFSRYTLAQKRSGISGVEMGIEVVILIFILSIAVYAEAFTLPGALTAMATSALVSVNPGIVTLFQVVVPLAVIFTTILLFIAIIRHVIRSGGSGP